MRVKKFPCYNGKLRVAYVNTASSSFVYVNFSTIKTVDSATRIAADHNEKTKIEI